MAKKLNKQKNKQETTREKGTGRSRHLRTKLIIAFLAPICLFVCIGKCNDLFGKQHCTHQRL